MITEPRSLGYPFPGNFGGGDFSNSGWDSPMNGNFNSPFATNMGGIEDSIVGSGNIGSPFSGNVGSFNSSFSNPVFNTSFRPEFAFSQPSFGGGGPENPLGFIGNLFGPGGGKQPGGGNNQFMFILLILMQLLMGDLGGDDDDGGERLDPRYFPYEEEDGEPEILEEPAEEELLEEEEPEPTRAKAKAEAKAEAKAQEKPAEPAQVTTATGTPGSIWGDPHVVGIRGGKFDFHPHGNFRMLEDSNIQWDAELGTPPGGIEGTTYVLKNHVKVGKGNNMHNVTFGVDGPPTFDGVAMKDGETKTFDSGIPGYKATVSFQGGKTIVNTGEYTITMEPKVSGNVRYQDVKVQINNKGNLLDGTEPHGVVGQTATQAWAANPKIGKEGHGAMGEGAIEGTVNDYRSDNFKFKRFGLFDPAKKQEGVGAGAAGNAA